MSEGSAKPLQDPQELLRDQCAKNKQCRKLAVELGTCTDRVTANPSIGETCEQELFDFLSCRESCVSKILFKHLNGSKVSDTGGPLLLTGRNVTILSLNTKLLPESRSRTFNLAHVCRRARQIANIIIHATTGGTVQLKDPSSTGKNSFMAGGGPHGDSISQVSYGYLDKSAAYGDNFSENRSLVSGTERIDVIVSGANGLQSGGGGGAVPNGDSCSVGGGLTLAPDQMTVVSLRSVEGMWQRRALHQEKTESCVTLKSDVPVKQLAINGLPGSSHTLESLNSESRSRVSEPNPSTMSVSSRMHGIPALALANNTHHNGSVVLSVGSGSGNDQQQQQQQPQRSALVAARPSSQQIPNNQAPPDAPENEQASGGLLVAPSQSQQQQVGSTQSTHSAVIDLPSGASAAAAVPAAPDLPSVAGVASVGFSSTVCMPSDCPPADIVCLQEVADSRANQIVTSRLLTVYPHILHSAKRYHGCHSCPITVGNLVIASKFPVLCARYHEQLTTFGKRALLVAKLLLQHVGEQKIVAIVGNVYVKRSSALTILEPGDFDEIVKWLRSFRNDAISSDVNDVLSLDVSSGYIDLPEDGVLVNEILQHEFFLSYISPTMHASTGDALFGAELQPLLIHDAEVNQPESLHHTIFRYHPNGPHLSQLFRRLSDAAGETAPFSLLRSSFLRYCRDTPDTEQSPQQQHHRLSKASSSRGGVTTAFAGLTPHLGLNASFQQS